MRLKEFQIKNFKAFGETVTIPIKPITLIFGPNSSGKSSILQALNLLKQSSKQIRTEDHLGAVPLQKGELFNFSSYKELKYKEGDIEFVFPFSTQSIDPKEYIKRYILKEDNTRAWIEVWLNKQSQTREMIDFVKEHFKKVCMIISEEGISGLQFGEITKPTFINEDCEIIPDTQNIFWKKYWNFFDKGKEDELIDQAVSFMKKDEIGFLSDLQEEFLEEIQEAQAGFQKALICYSYLFIEHFFCPRFFPEYFNYFDEDKITGRNPAFLEVYLGQYIQTFIDSLSYIGPLRDYPERYYLFQEPDSLYVETKGEFFPHLLNIILKSKRQSQVAKSINQELSTLQPNTRLEIVKMSNRKHGLDDVFVVHLLNSKTKKSISLKNMGFGFSQILPIVTQCVISSDQTILIEQPELHIHPDMQAKLGDLFIRSALKEPEVDFRGITTKKANRFLIETHSEHLILRLLRRIRETTEGRLPKNIPSIKPEDVAVLYVQPGEKGAEVIEIPISEDGEFTRPWPHGFFSGRAKELF